jgi:hypothetical protein
MSDPQRPPMEPIRGTVLLCDHVAQMINNKWLIAGTHTSQIVPPGVPAVMLMLNVYLRFQVERAGPYHFTVRVINTSLDSNHPAIVSLGADAHITDPLVPFEYGCQFPPIMVESPPAQDAHPRGIRLLAWLRVDGTDVASSPLSVIFLPPTEAPTHDHPDCPPGIV